MEICKAPTLRLKALNKHSIAHIMYIEMEMLSVIKMCVCVRACGCLCVCVCVCVHGGMFVGWCTDFFNLFFNKIMFCLMGIDHNILNHLVRLLPPGATTIGSFIFSTPSMRYPYAYQAFSLWKEDMRCYLTSATMLVRTVYKVRQAVYESAQVFTQKHWKRSFTLSLSGAESTVSLLSLDQQHSADHWTYGPFSHVGCQDKTGHGRLRQVQVSQKLRLSTGGNPWKIITGSDWQPGTFKTPSEYCRRAFYALSRHFPSTFWIPKQNEDYRG